jgi:hypothetical protein
MTYPARKEVTKAAEVTIRDLRLLPTGPKKALKFLPRSETLTRVGKLRSRSMIAVLR